MPSGWQCGPRTRNRLHDVGVLGPMTAILAVRSRSIWPSVTLHDSNSPPAVNAPSVNIHGLDCSGKRKWQSCTCRDSEHGSHPNTP